MPPTDLQEWQLLSLFEVEPEYLYPEDPWPYTDAAYSISRDGFELSCAIHPAYSDIRIILKRDAQRIFELNAMGVQDIRYSNESGIESLHVQISASESLTLRVRPTICIEQSFDGRPRH